MHHITPPQRTVAAIGSLIAFGYAVSLFLEDERSPVLPFTIGVALALVALIGIERSPLRHMRVALRAWPWTDIAKFGSFIAVAVIAAIGGTAIQGQKTAEAEAKAAQARYEAEAKATACQKPVAAKEPAFIPAPALRELAPRRVITPVANPNNPYDEPSSEYP